MIIQIHVNVHIVITIDLLQVSNTLFLKKQNRNPVFLKLLGLRCDCVSQKVMCFSKFWELADFEFVLYLTNNSKNSLNGGLNLAKCFGDLHPDIQFFLLGFWSLWVDITSPNKMNLRLKIPNALNPKKKFDIFPSLFFSLGFDNFRSL